MTAPVTITAADAAGTYTAVSTLSDTTDHATPVSVTTKVKVTADPVLKLTTSGTPTAASAGTSYTLTLTPATTAAGGVAYHHPVLTTTLPAGEKFTATPTPTGWSCALSNSTRTLTCTSTKTTPIATGTTLGKITAPVTITAADGAGTYTAVSTLSDTTDHATPVSVTTKVKVTTDPVLKLTTSGTPASASAGTSYTLTLTPSTKATGGPAYHDPALTVTLPTGEKFTSDPAPTGWTCALSNSTKTLTCTSTSATPIAAGTALSPVTAPVTITAADGAGNIRPRPPCRTRQTTQPRSRSHHRSRSPSTRS